MSDDSSTRDRAIDPRLRCASEAVARCFSPAAEVEPSRSREFFNYIADEVLRALAGVPAPDVAARDWRVANPAHAKFCDGSCDNGASMCPRIDMAGRP